MASEFATVAQKQNNSIVIATRSIVYMYAHLQAVSLFFLFHLFHYFVYKIRWWTNK